MTLILALKCSDGIVLASDSQATFGTNPPISTNSTEKLYIWESVAWGASGHVGITQRVRQHLASLPSQKSLAIGGPSKFRENLTKEIAGIIRPLYRDQFLQLHGDGSLQTAFIFVCWLPRGPLILEIHQNLSDTEFTDKGYTAIGSGDAYPLFALTTIQHLSVHTRPLAVGKVVAYRTMSEAIEASDTHIAEPIQMIEIPEAASDAPGRPRLIPEDELLHLNEQVATWQTIEHETLGNLGLPAGVVTSSKPMPSNGPVVSEE